jgi:hypothetical protein
VLSITVLMVISVHRAVAGLIATMRLDRITDCAVIGLRNCLAPFLMLLFTLFGRSAARGAHRLAKATVRDGILVARLPAPSPKHSFSTFSSQICTRTSFVMCAVSASIA